MKLNILQDRHSLFHLPPDQSRPLHKQELEI